MLMGQFTRLLVLVIGICTGGHLGFSEAPYAPRVNPERAAVISGVIAGGNLLALVEPLEKMARDGTGLPIDLIISSPGGEVNTGFLFINIMEDLKSRGVKLRCFVPTIAASMAFQILTHCDERYALERSLLLFHRVRVQLGGGLSPGVPMTAPDARALSKDLQILDNTIWRELTESLDMDADLMAEAFESERLWVARDLEESSSSFIKTYKAIPGLIDALLSKAVLHAPQAGGQDIRGISYIFRGVTK